MRSFVKCRIPGCEKYPPYRRRHLCTGCWKLYGGRTTKDRPAWVNFLINRHQREYEYQTGRGRKLVSLDWLVDTARLDVDSLHPMVATDTRRRKRTQGMNYVHLRTVEETR